MSNGHNNSTMLMLTELEVTHTESANSNLNKIWIGPVKCQKSINYYKGLKPQKYICKFNT